METGLIELDSKGVYRPTDTLVTFLNTDIHIHGIQHYNRMELMKNNTNYTLSKEPIMGHGFNTPMKLQITTTNNGANYGDPIPIFVY
jgi:hypothetical protein